MGGLVLSNAICLKMQRHPNLHGGKPRFKADLQLRCSTTTGGSDPDCDSALLHWPVQGNGSAAEFIAQGEQEIARVVLVIWRVCGFRGDHCTCRVTPKSSACPSESHPEVNVAP